MSKNNGGAGLSLDEIKSRINPDYSATIGTESHERKWLCDRVDVLEGQRGVLLAEVTALRLERDMRKMAEARNAELLKQRDKLLAAMERLERGAESGWVVDIAKSAIASVKGGAE